MQSWFLSARDAWARSCTGSEPHGSPGAAAAVSAGQRFRGDVMAPMARLPERGRRGLEQLRLIAADASSAGLTAERALAALDAAVPFDDGALFALDSSSLVFTRLLAYRGAE